MVRLAGPYNLLYDYFTFSEDVVTSEVGESELLSTVSRMRVSSHDLLSHYCSLQVCMDLLDSRAGFYLFINLYSNDIGIHKAS